MQRHMRWLVPRRWLVTALATAGLALSGCADVSDAEDEDHGPATVVEVEGSTVKRITLTAKAAERLDIRTAPVADDAGTQFVPYAAVVYDPTGATWVYTSPESLTFVRSPINVVRIAGDRAFLAGGPPTGTPVVTVGTAELYGTENEIGH